MITLIEPQWGITLLQALHTLMIGSQALSAWVKLGADVFVFIYPVYFLVVYFRGKFSHLVINPYPSKLGPLPFVKGHFYYKMGALWIGVATVMSVAVNIFIQFFVDKQRPNIVLGLADEKTETILHRFLPASSFPSDHAALSMGIAMASLYRGIWKKDRRFVWFGIILIVCSLIMSFCRVTIGIHRLTDVIAGSVVGIVVPLVINPYPSKLGPLPFIKGHQWMERILMWVAKKV